MPDELLPVMSAGPGVVISLPRGVTGPSRKAPLAATAALFGVFHVGERRWFTDVVALEVLCGVPPHGVDPAEVVLSRLVGSGPEVVMERHVVLGFTLDGDAMAINHDLTRGALVQVCTCPVITGGHVQHHTDCSINRVVSGG